MSLGHKPFVVVLSDGDFKELPTSCWALDKGIIQANLYLEPLIVIFITHEVYGTEFHLRKLLLSCLAPYTIIPVRVRMFYDHL